MLVVRFHDPGVEMPSVVPDREFRVRSVSPGTAMTAESRTFTLARVLFFVMLFGAPLAFGAVQP